MYINGQNTQVFSRVSGVGVSTNELNQVCLIKETCKMCTVVSGCSDSDPVPLNNREFIVMFMILVLEDFCFVTCLKHVYKFGQVWP